MLRALLVVGLFVCLVVGRPSAQIDTPPTPTQTASPLHPATPIPRPPTLLPPHGSTHAGMAVYIPLVNRPTVP